MFYFVLILCLAQPPQSTLPARAVPPQVTLPARPAAPVIEVAPAPAKVIVAPPPPLPVKVAVKSPCSSACTCGCNDGKPCTCRRGAAAPTATVPPTVIEATPAPRCFIDPVTGRKICPNLVR